MSEIKCPCGLRYNYDGFDWVATGKSKQFAELTRLQAVVAGKDEEIRRLKIDREGWSAISLSQFNRIGKALDLIRKKRPNGEVLRDDATEIEQLVTDLARETERAESAEKAMKEAKRIIEIAQNGWHASYCKQTPCTCWKVYIDNYCTAIDSAEAKPEEVKS